MNVHEKSKEFELEIDQKANGIDQIVNDYFLGFSKIDMKRGNLRWINRNGLNPTD